MLTIRLALYLLTNVTHFLVSTNRPNSSKNFMRKKRAKNQPPMGHPRLLRLAYVATTPSRTDMPPNDWYRHSNEPVQLPQDVLKRRILPWTLPMATTTIPPSTTKTTDKNSTNQDRSMVTMMASRPTEIRVLGTPGKGVTTRGGLATQANGEAVIRWKTCRGRWEGWNSNRRDNLRRTTILKVVHGSTQMRAKLHRICNSSNIWTGPSSNKDVISSCTLTRIKS